MRKKRSKKKKKEAERKEKEGQNFRVTRLDPSVRWRRQIVEFASVSASA
jgi:hypothetical protein